MQRRAVLFLVLAAFLVSCKKGMDTGPSYNFWIQRDGSYIEYATAAGSIGASLSNPNRTVLSVSASDYNGELFDISIETVGSRFYEGTYYSNSASYLVYVSNSVHNLGSSGTVQYDLHDSPGLPPSSYTVRIDEITSSYIKGEFSGNYLTNYFGGFNPTVQVTQGGFTVKRTY
ncbi:MAG: hypothetical protein EOO08_03160 [Chitinophagaceae bacterium]|nr:MAG: hypothetical protein EOO08_03160 [Chitinophagaceae bacterium]